MTLFLLLLLFFIVPMSYATVRVFARKQCDDGVQWCTRRIYSKTYSDGIIIGFSGIFFFFLFFPELRRQLKKKKNTCKTIFVPAYIIRECVLRSRWIFDTVRKLQHERGLAGRNRITFRVFARVL